MEVMLLLILYVVIGLGAANVAWSDTHDLWIALTVVIGWPILIGVALANMATGRS